MAGLQLAEHRTGGDPLRRPAPTARRAHSWSATRQDGRSTPAADLPAHPRRPRCPGRGVHRLTGCPGEVDTAMSAVPVRRRGVEHSHHIRARAQRPVQPLPVGRGGGRQDDRSYRQGDPSHQPSSPRRIEAAPGPGADLWIIRSVWKKHPRTACKLLSAARLSGLTSRVCATTRFQQGRIRMPAVSLRTHRDGSGNQQAPGLGVTRRCASTDNKEGQATTLWLL